MDDLTREEKREMDEAVKKLGYIGWRMTYQYVGFRRYRLKAGGYQIGIYDLDRHTFVD